MSKFNELIKGETPVIVCFYADWSPSCEAVEESLRQFKQSHEASLKLIRIDFDKNESVAQKLNVIGVPTVILFKEGKVLFQESGLIDTLNLSEALTN